MTAALAAPERICSARLADVSEIVMGQSPPSSTYNSESVGLPFLQGKAEFGTVSPRPGKWCNQPIKLAKPGSVLISVRAPVGDVNVADQTYCIGRGLAAIAAGPDLLPEYLYYHLLTQKRAFEELAGGSTFQSINGSVLRDHILLVPPLDEQRRIARILSTIQRARELNAPVLAHSERLKRKLIEHLFAPDSRPGNSTEWRVVPIGSLCTGMFDGPHATPTKTDEGPVFLSISSLNQGQLDLTRSAHLSENDFVRWTRRVVPQADDVVFSYETRLGEVALLPKGLRCCLGRRLALMRPDTAKVEPWFLTYVYLSPAFQQTLADNTVIGSTVHRLPLNRFADFPIEVPSLETQRLIVRILREIDRKIECESSINRALESLAVSSLSSLVDSRTLQTR